MKKYIYNTSRFTAAIALLFMVISCETTNLDINDNPNELTLDSADPNYVLNGIQFSFVGQHFNLSSISSRTMRHVHQFGTYASSSGQGTMNGAWSSAYSIANNLNLLEDLSEARNLPNHVGIGQVLEAFAFINLVDYIGTAVYSEAVNPDFPAPNLDGGQSIYNAMYDQLTDAVANLSATGSVAPEDLFYDGDMSKWIKLANTLKIKMYVQTKLVTNPNAVSEINAILASGNYISTSADDFVARYGTNVTNPDTRHPNFVGAYQVSAGGQYMSNDFMNTLLYGKSNPDPRLRYYIYRQTDQDPTGTLIPCAGDPNYQYCYVGNGYWGRDHADDEGIPNDGSLRATYGIYPAGGAYDDDSFKRTPESTNLGGAGIHPMVLSSFTKFWLAEAALPAPAGLGTNGNSRTYLMNAMQDSFDKVESFSGVAMVDADVTSYINEVLAEYDGAADDQERLAIIIREYYIAMWGNSIEAYNNYRRTGYPTLGMSVIANTAFPRSYFIPSSELNSNDNPALEQKKLTDQVFWDTNPAGFID
ncbi:SusD/RagB family nutrient-binding outer membrane lipoprotein [Geojedonia litorea]|uniref:SusD/RagB family nutrient-binding outer membrane lipoprotein n=1 Tax=Geojedonia litorea TaxID=1268269 RepID=A0ABV9N1W2_9FLAO